MKSIRLIQLGGTAAAVFLLPGLPLMRSAYGLGTTQRIIHSYSWGDRSYPCLLLDGGEVPLPVAPVGGPTVQAGDGGIAITWPKDGASAVIRDASKIEAALLDLMGKQEAEAAWKKYMASTLRGNGYTYTVHDYQPDCMDVNHWRIGTIAMDYAIGGRKSSSLLMLWRSKDGANLAVTMQSGPDEFKGHCDELASLIGGALVIPPGR